MVGVREGPMYDLELEALASEVRRLRAGKVLIQMPFGLRRYAAAVARAVEEAGAIPIFHASPCHGACDLAICAASALGADMIAHYGHARIPGLRGPDDIAILFLEARMDLDVRPVVEKALELLRPYGPIGVATIVQHIHVLEDVVELVERAGHDALVGKAGGRALYDGQVLGCDYTTVRNVEADVEAFLVVGSDFHALGVAVATGKPTAVANPYEGVARRLEEEARRALARRYASIEEAREAERFGIIIGLKPGQMNMDMALRALELVREAGKKAFLMAADEVRPEYLADFTDVDAFVNTACPRLSLEDAGAFGKPLLTLPELEVALGLLGWEELCERGWFAAPGS